MNGKSAADEGGRYEIRLNGHLHSRWATWFDGMRLTRCRDGTTVIHGVVPDQASLHGLLQKVRDIGVPLVSVTRLEADQSDPPPTASESPSINSRSPA